MTASAPAQAMVGAVLSARYRLLRLLGEGGMGAVFEAQDLMGQGRYAVKVLHPEYAQEERVLSRLYTEAEAMSRLVHPNIARCFGYALAEDRSPYLIMELLEGASLASYLKPGLAYEPQYAIPIVRGILAALAEAHRQGIVHRDVKPDNVFLVPNPAGPPVVKVLDFGIAKVMDAAGGMMSKTRTGMLLGTPSYMSPEQIRNAKGVDHRADLWSVGILFYELLSGREAFAAPNELAKLTMILTGDVSPIEEGKPALALFRGFFARALARDVDQRFASAVQMDEAVATVERTVRSGGALGGPASTTDMSPELPQGVSLGAGSPQIQIVAAPPIAPRRPVRALDLDQTLRASDAPIVTAPGAGVRAWIVVVVAFVCLAIGLAAGLLVGRL
jgi:eukaryotic-like serine/threonine-protein kinase